MIYAACCEKARDAIANCVDPFLQFSTLGEQPALSNPHQRRNGGRWFQLCRHRRERLEDSLNRSSSPERIKKSAAKISTSLAKGELRELARQLQRFATSPHGLVRKPRNHRALGESSAQREGRNAPSDGRGRQLRFRRDSARSRCSTLSRNSPLWSKISPSPAWASHAWPIRSPAAN